MARRALRERRIGHTGTLDPMAEGLLLLCVGQATRLQQYLMRWRKSYHGQIRLGHATTTYDGEGEAMDPQGSPPAIDGELVGRLQGLFEGEINQMPPPYSAKKVAGRRLYELARSGRTAEVDPKKVTVHELGFEVAGPELLSVDVTTSTGFYVRSLAHDVGLELGCGGFLEKLCRVAIGPYRSADALPQELLERAVDPQEVLDSPSWIPMDQIALPFPRIQLNSAAADRFINGQEVVVFRPGGGDFTVDSEVMVQSTAERLLGIGVVTSVLARGRTIGVRPTVVLQTGANPAQPPPAADENVATD
jgi:tRNA pseudouridine55 synthase